MLAVGSPAADLTATLHVSHPQTGSLPSKLDLDALELVERVIGHLDRDVMAKAREVLQQHLDPNPKATSASTGREDCLVLHARRNRIRGDESAFGSRADEVTVAPMSTNEYRANYPFELRLFAQRRPTPRIVATLVEPTVLVVSVA